MKMQEENESPPARAIGLKKGSLFFLLIAAFSGLARRRAGLSPFFGIQFGASLGGSLPVSLDCHGIHLLWRIRMGFAVGANLHQLKYIIP